jgi:membrane protease YdiL (CAAX protease family)
MSQSIKSIMHQSLQKILYFPITKIILGIAICFSIFIVVQNFVLKPILYSLVSNKNVADPIIHLVSVFVLLFSYYFFFRLFEKRPVSELSTKYFPKEIFGSFIFGFLSIALSIFILYLLGNYHFISISTENYAVKLFTTLVVAALIEDLFHRGLLLRELENWLGTHTAIVLVMLLETIHIFNPNANVLSFFVSLCWGFTMSMLFVYTKRIWLPFFFHLGWNFAQPFFGSNLTGLNNLGTIIQAKFEGPELLTGGKVGIENSIINIILLLSIGVYFYYRARKEGKIIARKTVH